MSPCFALLSSPVKPLSVLVRPQSGMPSRSCPLLIPLHVSLTVDPSPSPASSHYRHYSSLITGFSVVPNPLSVSRCVDKIELNFGWIATTETLRATNVTATGVNLWSFSRQQQVVMPTDGREFCFLGEHPSVGRRRNRDIKQEREVIFTFGER